MLRISYRRKLLLKKVLRTLLVIVCVVAVASITLLIYLEPYVTYDREGAHLNLKVSESDAAPSAPADARPVVGDAQLIVQAAVDNSDTITDMSGFYITTKMLRDPQKVLDTVRALKEPCAVMLQLKSTFGNFYYSTSIDGAPTADVDIEGIDQLISYLRSHGFYMIAEIPAFCDSAFALEHQTCGLPLSGGALWMDERSCYWLDPASETVVSYLMQIARELSSLGFQEVAFSEFRFPASNNIDYKSDKTRAQLVAEAAQELTTFFTGSNLTISFVTDETEFPVSACSGRLYIPDVDGSKVEKYVQAYGGQEQLSELVFLADSKDTRFEGQAILRPMLTQ